jgi:hypothetical protein
MHHRCRLASIIAARAPRPAERELVAADVPAFHSFHRVDRIPRNLHGRPDRSPIAAQTTAASSSNPINMMMTQLASMAA